MADARFAVGIDLGTTNTVIAAVPITSESGESSVVPVPQLVAMGTVESRASLPSFTYLASHDPQAESALKLPWSQALSYAVGELARLQSASQPDRTVGAAKSWLAHRGVDRQRAILPWNAPDDVARISPVTAAQYYLQHVREAWDHAHPETPLQHQHVVLTVPASFDASARELTREAASLAGLPADLILLEEPQAAVYAWLSTERDGWRDHLQLHDRLLVCDVGGGTTDLTLIEAGEQNGELELSRVAVGNHLLVGGDNMDLYLAHQAAEQLKQTGTQLDPWQSVSLWHACRRAKEVLFGEDAPETYSLSVLGRGSKLLGGTKSVEINSAEIAQKLLDGFFPHCGLQDQPEPRRQSGFQEIGLPYEADTAVTRHVAQFLERHTADRAPSHVLFNGGVFRGSAFRDRLLEVLGHWFPNTPQSLQIPASDLDHAVARGAAYYAWSKRNGGIRIRGGTARAYYVGIETSGLAIPGAPRPLQALCVVPFGMEEGTETDVPSGDIGLVLDQPARFRFFGSSIRKQDQPGTLLNRWNGEELVESDAMETTLRSTRDADDAWVPVRFRARITELGTLELWCVSTRTDEQWKLEFSVRDP